MSAKNNFTLFIENFKDYKNLTENENHTNKHFDFFKTMKSLSSEECLEYLKGMQSYLNVKNLNEAVENTDNTELIYYNKVLDIFKNYISLIINIEYIFLSPEYSKFIGKEKCKRKIFSRFQHLRVEKLTEDKKNKESFFYWKKSKKHEKLICPYCNIQYLNYNNGYTEVDHIFPQSHYPALINVEVNHLESCRKCNNAKKDNSIDFNINELYELHNNNFLANSFVFNDELFKQIDNNNFLENMINLSKKKTTNAEGDRVSTRNKLNEINMYMMISNFSIDNNLHKLKILERYQSLHKILYRMYKKFTFSISKLGPEMECAYQSYSDDMEAIYDYMFKTQTLQNLFDDFTDVEREQLEVIYYWRKEFVKSMIYQYIQDIKEKNGYKIK